MTAALERHGLRGLAHLVCAGIDALREQSAATGAALNNKFVSEASFELAYGGLDVFFGGLESLIGPPTLVNGSVLTAMSRSRSRKEGHLAARLKARETLLLRLQSSGPALGRAASRRPGGLQAALHAVRVREPAGSASTPRPRTPPCPSARRTA